MSVVDSALGLLTAGAKLLARAVGFKPGPPFKALKGPPHVYAPPKSILEHYFGINACLHCQRVDPDQTPYTDPPCPRTGNPRQDRRELA